jgi:S-adenosylhomocysteine hydrolase
MPILTVALRADLGCGTGHSCFVISSSFARKTIAQIEHIAKPYGYMVGKVDAIQTELMVPISALAKQALTRPIPTAMDPSGSIRSQPV